MILVKSLRAFSFMNIQELFLLIVVSMNVVLATLILLSNRRNPVNLWFAAFAGSLVLWSGTLIVFRTTGDKDLAILFLKFAYLSAIFIASSLYVFIHYFLERKPFTRTKKWILFLSTLFVAFILLLPNVLVVDIRYTPEARVGIQDPLGYIIFSLYFIFYFFGALYLLFRRWRTAAGSIKTRIGYVIWSILTAGLFGVFFNLILPSPWIQEWRFTWLGPIFTAVIVVAIAYAIAKHHLLNIRILAAEALTGVIVFTLFAQIVFARTFREFIIRTTFFVIGAFFSLFLIRSVRRESHQKEQLEKLAIQLGKANTELKKLDQLKSDFLSFATHQLRSPLSTIKGYLSMVLEESYGEVSGRVSQALKKVYRSNEQLIRLVDDFLNLSRIEEGKMEYHFAKASVEDVVEEVIDSLQENAKHKRLKLIWRKPVPPMPEITMDAGKIHEVIYNLVDNAIKYTQRGQVEILARKTNHALRIVVVDTGVGLDEDEIATLFQRFRRAGRGSTVHVGGAGIGLYIAKYIVEAHHGKIWTESPGRNQGSTFFVELPLRPEKPNG